MKLSDLPNIGRELEQQLTAAGIDSPEKLRELGAVESCKMLKLSGPVCYNKLYALEGAILGLRWHNLPKEHMEKVKENFAASVD